MPFPVRILAALAVLCAAHGVGQAQERYFTSGPSWTGPVEATQSVALGDVDGDGDLDLVRGNVDQGTTLYRNTGGTFASAPTWMGPSRGTASVALGDVDGDGDLDLVQGNLQDRGPALYLNTGDTFTATAAWTGPPTETQSVALGDVDGDGDLDLVCGNRAHPTAVYLNAGGHFGDTPASTLPGEWTTSVALGDVDGDGDLDLVRGTYARGVLLHRNVGGTFSSTPAWTGPAQNTESVALGDVNGDGWFDIVSGSQDQGAALFLNDGAGSFPAPPSWTGPMESTVSVALGDVDGDGDLDLVRGNPGQAATLYLNIGYFFDITPAWAGPQEYTRSVALGDVDGDGQLDLVRGNSIQPATLYRNEGPGFRSLRYWQGVPSPVAATGDVDGDGDLDIIEIHYNSVVPFPELRLFRNDSGVFTGPHWVSPPIDPWGGSLLLRDVDNDGDPDLVFMIAGTIYLFSNSGGGFAVEPTWTRPVEAGRAVALGDIDDDGHLDLVVGRFQLPVLYLKGDRAVEIGRAEATVDLGLGDVDGDGDVDILRYNGRSPSTLYLNTGGVFAADPAWTGRNVGWGPLVDVDGDGDLDHLRWRTDRGAALFINNGASFFPESPVWEEQPSVSNDGSLGDIDADGDLDLVLRGSPYIPARVYLNAGGAFPSTPTYELSDWTDGPASGDCTLWYDVDGDGGVDLVVKAGLRGKVHLRKSPWLVIRHFPTRITPASHLPNNPAHLRWVSAILVDANRYRVSFQAVDVEGDSLWLVGEYQFEGSPVWYPMQLDGSPLRAGPFSTSSEGVEHEVAWDVGLLPFDHREVVIRLRALSPPRRSGVIQFVPSYLHKVGRIVPGRPALAVSPAALDFATMTVGDRSRAMLTLSNPGTRDLVVDRIESPDPDVLVQADSGLVVPPDGVDSVEVVLAPRRRPSSLGPLRIQSNDPVTPVLDVPLVTDIRSLVVTTQLLGPPELPLGEAATVVVTPAPQVQVERGALLFRTRGAAAFSDSTALVARESDFLALVPGQHVTEAGLEYYIRVENNGVFATDPPQAPDSTFFHPVASPGGISAAAQPDLADSYPTGRPTPIVVSLPQGSRFESGRLFFRPGGSSALYDSLDLALVEVAPGVFSPSALAPGEALGPRGLEYWVRVRTVTRVLTDPARDAAQRPRSLRTNVALLEESAVHGGGRYRMLSVPLDLSLPATASLEALLVDEPDFGRYDPTRWRAFRYLAEAGGYVEMPRAESANGKLRPEPGRGFWLVARAANRLDTAPVAGRSTPTEASYRIVLDRGWNQIGNPYLFAVSWRDVRAEGASGAVVVEPPVAWDEDAGRYREEDVDVLQPFEGYWVWNPTSEAVDLWIPADEVTAQSPAHVARGKGGTGEDPVAWRLQIAASCGPAVDTRNFVGVAALAREGDDSLDRTDPPLAPGAALSLYFLDTEAEGNDGERRLTADIQPVIAGEGDPASRGRRFVFDVRRAGGESLPPEVRLEFQGQDGLPSDVELRLIDRTLERTLDLREERDYTFVAGRGDFVPRASEARFEILAGTQEFVAAIEADLAARPRQTRLLPGIPNPVVSTAVVRFETARAGKVRVCVYDVRGRLVRTLADGARAAGRHEVAWLGEDDRRRHVPPGVYFLRLVAPDRTDTRKLVKIQ